MWLKHSEERAHTEGLKVHCWNLAPVHICIPGIENSQWRLARIPTASPLHEQSASMLLFCIFFVSRLLSLYSRAFNISAGRLVWQIAGKSCLALLKPGRGVDFKPPPFCWSCFVAYFLVLWQNSSGAWLSFYRRYAHLCASRRGSGESRSWGCGAHRGLSAAGCSHCHSHQLVLPEQNTEIPKTSMERYWRKHRSLPFPQGRIIYETDTYLALQCKSSNSTASLGGQSKSVNYLDH